MVAPAVHVAPRAADERRERITASPQFRAGRFHNTSGVIPNLSQSQHSLLREYVRGGVERVPKRPLPTADPRPTWQTQSTALRLTWLGHSTMLIESGGKRILTDPVWGLRASPLSFMGPRRFFAPPAAIADLPPLDAILISHDHYDHLCQESVRTLARLQSAPFVTSLGVGQHLARFGIAESRIVEVDWGQAWTAPGGALRLTAEPCQHFSGRSLGDRNRTLWSAWVIRTDDHQVFFSGDTGLTDEFAAIAARHGRFDATMLEVGAFHPAWGQIHLGPRNAMTAFDMLGGGTLVPVHWATFNLALHAWHEPGEVLAAEAGARRICLPRPGQAFRLDEDLEAPWWR